jgi:hypothetical protein
MAAILSLMPWAPVPASDYPAFEAGGLLFGDLYHVASHHSAEGDGATGLVLRRGYLTFDARFSDAWFGRLRFEVNQAGEFESYSFEAQTKDLHFGRKLGRHKVLLGLSPTPTYDLVELIWGLRYLARTPMDLQGVPSRDTGLSAQGPLNASGSLAYRLMYAAPVDFGADSGGNERWMGALSWRPASRWTIDVYADHEARDGPRDRSTRQVFVAYQSEDWRWGALYSDQDRQSDPPLELASLFVVGKLGERSSLVGRVDRLLEPSPRGNDIAYLPMDPSSRAYTVFAGWEYRLSPHFRLTPNAVVTRYDRNGEGFRPETDVHLRLTAFIDFE